MSLIAELKRRKVVQVGVAYLIVAWLVIQVGATVAPQLALPEWAPRLITLLVLLGFPISLVIAWMVDVTPEGIKVESAGFGNKRVFTVAAVLAALAIGWFLRGYGGATAPDTPEAVAALGERSTAVLPFVNMSADKDNEYFSDGLTETLLHKLAQVSELKVAARTSSFAFKGKQQDVRSIGAELGVATVVEGSVQRAGDTLRITAQLVRTADGSHIWSESYDRKQTDLFAIQDEIAAKVTEKLIGALVPEARAAIAKGATADLAAYELYARGLQELAIGTYASLDRAERAMQQALERDPRYVDALVGLVGTWWAMAWTGKITGSEFATRSPPWLDKIAALDPDRAMLFAYRAWVANNTAGRDEALRWFERGVAAHPGHAELRGWYAWYVRFGPNPAAALDPFDQAIALDPLNPDLHLGRGVLLAVLDRLEEAEQAIRRSGALDPADPGPPVSLADLALQRGDIAGFLVGYIGAHRIDAHDHEVAADVALRLDDIGERTAADAWLAQSRRLTAGSLIADANAVVMHYARGEREAALAGAIAIAGRPAEERRSNWIIAISAGCLAAAELGRADALRAALEQSGSVPRELTAAGFQSVVAPRLSLRHQVTHFAGLAPCLYEPGAAGAPARAAMLALAEAELGAALTQERRFRLLDGVLRSNRDRIVASVAPDPGKPDTVENLSLRMGLIRWLGLSDDPAIVAHRTRVETVLAEARATLPAQLAAERLTLMPPSTP